MAAELPGGVRPRAIDPVMGPLRDFFRHRLAGAGLLLGAGLIALVWANSPYGATYHALLHTSASLRLGPLALEKTALHWVNDGVMGVFFFVVGLELKRELLEGELSSVRKAALPALCALGGMAAPAALYAAFNAGTPTITGWGVPMATDIAFALGVVALLGDRVSPAARVFITGIAVADDLGAIVVIALFYTGGISLWALGAAAAFFGVAVAMNAAGVRSALAFLCVGVAVWLCFVASGVHATLAAVVMAFTIPAKTRLDSRGLAESLERLVRRYGSLDLPAGHGLLTREEQEVLHGIDAVVEKGTAPLQRLEHALLPFVTLVVLPVFAFANAGVTLPPDAPGLFADPVVLGVAAGLVLGKPLGIVAAAFLAVRLRLAELPQGLSLADVAALGALAGVGFTMSLFIGELAFDEQAAVDAAKVGTLAASVVAGTSGYFLLRRRVRRR